MINIRQSAPDSNGAEADWIAGPVLRSTVVELTIVDRSFVANAGCDCLVVASGAELSRHDGIVCSTDSPLRARAACNATAGFRSAFASHGAGSPKSGANTIAAGSSNNPNMQ